MTRRPVEPVSVEPIEIPRDMPWSDKGVGSSADGHGLYMVVDDHELATAPGVEARTSVRVRNSGLHVERAVIELRGLPIGWVSVDPPELDLDIASEGTSVVSFHPSRHTSTGSGRFPFEFVVLSASMPTVRCVDGGALTVGTFTELTCEVTPPSISSHGSAAFHVELRNDGNEPVSGRMFADDPSGAVRTRLDPAEVALAPGVTGQLRLFVTPRRPMVSGAPAAHLVTLRLEGTTTLNGSPQARLEQRALLPRWAVKALTVAVALVAVLVTMVAWSAWSNRSRHVPDVRGLTSDQASETLEKKGFRVVEEVAAVSDKPKGVVDGERPSPGSRRRRKSAVVIVVSGGPATFPLADVVGKDAKESEAFLTSQKLVVAVETKPDSDIPAGVVTAQDPKPDTPLTGGQKVTLTVSSGKPRHIVPPLKGFTQDAAVAALQHVNLVPKVVDVIDSANVGLVVQQNPEGGEVEEGSTVVLTIGRSAGP